MPKTKIQKQEIARLITDKLSKSKSIIFTDYKGLTMSQLYDLRNQLKEVGGELSVTKNNLLKIALKNNKLEITDKKVFEGPIATLFSYADEIAPIKILAKSLKDFQKGSVKGGILDGEEIDATSIQKLASLPTKDELRAKVVGSLGTPLYGIVGVLQANLRNLVYALDQIKVRRLTPIESGLAEKGGV